MRLLLGWNDYGRETQKYWDKNLYQCQCVCPLQIQTGMFFFLRVNRIRTEPKFIIIVHQFLNNVIYSRNAYYLTQINEVSIRISL